MANYAAEDYCGFEGALEIYLLNHDAPPTWIDFDEYRRRIVG
jgi:hypothetical protein